MFPKSNFISTPKRRNRDLTSGRWKPRPEAAVRGVGDPGRRCSPFQFFGSAASFCTRDHLGAQALITIPITQLYSQCIHEHVPQKNSMKTQIY